MHGRRQWLLKGFQFQGWRSLHSENQLVVPDCAFFVELVRKCIRSKDLEQGRQVHLRVVDHGFGQNALIAGHLMQMYVECGSIQDAQRVFNRLKRKNVISWTRMIGGYCQLGDFRRALSMFYQMQKRDVIPTEVTYVTVLNACACPEALEDGMIIHQQIVDRGYEGNLYVGSALVNMYNKCGSVEGAWDAFNKLEERDVVVWTAMIAACVQHDEYELARYVYRLMQLEGFYCGRNVHPRSDPVARPGRRCASQNAVVNMYKNFGMVEESRKIFESMVVKDVVSWNIVMTLYVQNEMFKEAVQLFGRMQQEGFRANNITFVSVLHTYTNLQALAKGKVIHGIAQQTGDDKDRVVATALMNLYGKCAAPGQAWKIFDSIECKDAVAWTVMSVAYAQNGYRKEGLDLFHQMQLEGVKATSTTLVAALDTCAHLAALRLGKQIHSHIIENGLRVDMVVETALIFMYGKCGKLSEALTMFNSMAEKDIVAWNSMLGAYAQHGHYDETLELFNGMQLEGAQANNVTFVSVLSALSHSGKVMDGYHYYVSMIQDFEVSPTAEICGCVVDLLGRAGRIDEAVEFVEKLSGSQPDGMLWMALLAACKIHNKMEQARIAAERVLQTNPSRSGPYIVLSNAYAAVGDWDNVKRLRETMQSMGVRNEAGKSSIEVLNKVHEFETDCRHPKQASIYAELQALNQELRAAGYVPDSKTISHDVEDWHKEHLLSSHSERLAIAFGLLSTPPGTPLRIIKNLRVCSDCHTVTKFISKLRCREILVRDAHRFHSFKDGSCSCNDYW